MNSIFIKNIKNNLYSLMFFLTSAAFFLSTVDNMIPRVIFFIWHLCLSVSICIYIYLFYKRKKRLSFSYFEFFLIVWIFYSLLIFIINKQDILVYINALRSLTVGTMMVILLTNLIKSKESLLLFLRLLLLSSLIHNILSWSEFLYGKYFFVSDVYKELYGKLRLPTSSFYNTNDLATFMFLSSFFILILFILEENIILKSIEICIFISSIVIIFLTNSRANILGLVFSVLMTIFILFIKKIKRKRYFFIAVFFSITICLVFSNQLITLLLTTFPSLNNSSSNNIRINLIRNGFHFLEDSFFLGVGIGNIEYLMEKNSVFPINGIYPIHNWWFEILISSGIFFLLAYLFYFVKMIYDTCTVLFITSEKKYYFIYLIFIALLSGFIIAVTSTSSLFNRIWFWMFLGLINSFYLFTQENPMLENKFLE